MTMSFMESTRPYISALLFAVWSVLHSLFADMDVKERIEKVLGPSTNKWYRLIYVGLSTVTLIGVVVPVYFWPGEVIWNAQGVPKVMLNVVRMGTLTGLVFTAARTDMGDFLGLKKMTNRKTADRLVTDGAYRWVRHPLYSLGCIIIWANPRMSAGGMAISVVASLYLWLGTYHEEKGLRRIFGDEYEQYAREVPRLVPRLKREKK